MRNYIIAKINDQLETASARYTSTNDKVLDANRKAVEFAAKTVDAITRATPASDVFVPF